LALTSRCLHSKARDAPLNDDDWLIKAREAAEASPPDEPLATVKDTFSSGHLKSHVFRQLSPWKSKEELAKHLQASIFHNEGIRGYMSGFDICLLHY